MKKGTWIINTVDGRIKKLDQDIDTLNGDAIWWKPWSPEENDWVWGWRDDDPEIYLVQILGFKKGFENKTLYVTENRVFHYVEPFIGELPERYKK